MPLLRSILTSCCRIAANWLPVERGSNSPQQSLSLSASIHRLHARTRAFCAFNCGSGSGAGTVYGGPPRAQSRGELETFSVFEEVG